MERGAKAQWEIPGLSPVPHGGYKPSGQTWLSHLSHPTRAGSPQESPFGTSGVSHHPPLHSFQRCLGSTWNTQGQGTAWGPKGSGGTHFHHGRRSLALEIQGVLQGVPGGLWVERAVLQGAALGISKDQLVSPWAVTLPGIWGALGFELGESKEIPCGPTRHGVM